MQSPHFPHRIAVAVSLALTGWAAQAQSLSDLYQEALQYDATFKSARAQYEANLARAAQAQAGLYPTANLALTGSRSHFELSTPKVDRTFGTFGGTVSGNYPLYRPNNTATASQGDLQAQQARFAVQTAEQDLIVRLSQAYFDVLASQDSLTFVKAQKTAVGEQLAAAKRNFEVGTSTITDSREAQARYDLVLAQEIAAENDLRVKKIALDVIVGKTGISPKPLSAQLKLPEMQPADVNAWVAQSEEQHPNIQAAKFAIDVAKLETEKARSGTKPTVDATASYNITRNHDGSASSAISSRSNNASVGVVFNYPLFSGYAPQNRIKETLQLEEKAALDLEAAKRAVAQNTRSAYFGVISGQGQVKALEAAESSSQLALDANKLGYQVGVRINVDVLNSQSQLFQTKRDLAKARYDVLVGSLRLRQANGTLKPDDLSTMSNFLAK